MAKTKEEQVFIQVDNEVIELTGADKQAFLDERTQLQTDLIAVNAEITARKQARLSALQKLGLTEDEINAIL